jgi:hypothetical protein
MFRGDVDLFNRELKLRAAAGRVMQELQANGGGWQEAWKTHPVAVAYRKLLQEAWQRPVMNGYPMPKRP